MGRWSTPVWIDGRKYESLTEAKLELHLHPGTKRLARFKAALEVGGYFEGMRVSLTAPSVPPSPCAAPRAAAPLIAKPVTERLGVYREQRV